MWEFLVIGAGIAGISSAARLSSYGSCLVLERENYMAYHTSGRSAALYEVNYGSPSTIALAKAGRKDFDSLLSGGIKSAWFYVVVLAGRRNSI